MAQGALARNGDQTRNLIAPFMLNAVILIANWDGDKSRRQWVLPTTPAPLTPPWCTKKVPYHKDFMTSFSIIWVYLNSILNSCQVRTIIRKLLKWNVTDICVWEVGVGNVLDQISGTPMACIWVKMDDVPFVRGLCFAMYIWMLLVYHLSAWRSTNTCNLYMRKTETFVVFSSNSRQLHDSADVIRKRKMYYLYLVNEMLTITDTYQEGNIRREDCLKCIASSGHIRNIFSFISNSRNESSQVKRKSVFRRIRN